MTTHQHGYHKIIIQALVVSKLDYCNPLMADKAGYQWDKFTMHTKYGMQSNN